MTIHLPEELAQFIHEAVRTGRYAREDDVIRDAVSRLRQAILLSDESGLQDSKQNKALTKQEFQRHLSELGLMEKASDAGAKPSQPPDQANANEEEILSERMIRERLIEWLAGFI
jgi:putative addiction module CopG family antidote